MLYLIWTWILINLALLFGYFIIFFKAIRLVREKMGIVAAILFVVGFLSILKGASTWNFPEDKEFKFPYEEQFHKNLEAMDFSIVVDRTSAFDIRFYLSFYLREDTMVVPKYATCQMSGFVGSQTWVPDRIYVDQKDDKIKYTINGMLEWRLLGFVLFRQKKHYSGLAEIKNRIDE